MFKTRGSSWCYIRQYRVPMAEQVGCGTPCLLWSLGVREVVGSRPDGAIVRRVFHPTRKLVRFSLLKCPSIPNSIFFLKYVVPVGKCKLQTICVSLLNEASSHVNNYAYSGKLLLLLLLIRTCGHQVINNNNFICQTYNK